MFIDAFDDELAKLADRNAPKKPLDFSPKPWPGANESHGKATLLPAKHPLGLDWMEGKIGKGKAFGPVRGKKVMGPHVTKSYQGKMDRFSDSLAGSGIDVQNPGSAGDWGKSLYGRRRK